MRQFGWTACFIPGLSRENVNTPATDLAVLTPRCFFFYPIVAIHILKKYKFGYIFFRLLPNRSAELKPLKLATRHRVLRVSIPTKPRPRVLIMRTAIINYRHNKHLLLPPPTRRAEPVIQQGTCPAHRSISTKVAGFGERRGGRVVYTTAWDWVWVGPW